MFRNPEVNDFQGVLVTGDGALETRPLKIDITFFCNRCFGMATGKTCPHGEEDRIHISGTQQRAMLAEGAPVPKEFGRGDAGMTGESEAILRTESRVVLQDLLG